MITVTISINDRTIFARSARNQGEYNDEGETKYITDAGDVIYHVRESGAIELAVLMLDTINPNME